MQTRIGFDHYTIAHRGFTARQTLEFAQAHHFDGVQFLEPASIDPRLDHRRLRDFRRQAEAMGLYLEIGLPSPNPVHRSGEVGREVSPAELAQELLPHVEAVAALFVPSWPCVCGDSARSVPYRQTLAEPDRSDHRGY